MKNKVIKILLTVILLGVITLNPPNTPVKAASITEKGLLDDFNVINADNWNVTPEEPLIIGDLESENVTPDVWSTPKNIAMGPYAGSQSYPRIAAGTQDSLVVCWHGSGGTGFVSKAPGENWTPLEAIPDSYIVTFPDPNMDALIREMVNKPTGDIYSSELEWLTVLIAENKNITNISGIEYCINLQELNLHGNDISDISPLADLVNLTNLFITGNEISDLSPLESLTNLTDLFLTSNQISELSPLENLTKLTTLYLSFNRISDISPLQNLVNLSHLELSENQIGNLSPLAGLTNLGILSMYNNQVNDIAPLANLASLGHLDLSQNYQLSDISPLAGLNKLIMLSLGNDQISDISPLAGLASLRSVHLTNNLVTDISPLVANQSISAGADINIKKNPLSPESVYIYIPAIAARDVNVDFDDKPLSVITGDVYDITIDSATLNGRLESLGAHNSMDATFEWGETQGGPYANETAPQTLTIAGDFTAALSGLNNDTTYYYRAKAEGVVTVYGEELSFTAEEETTKVKTKAATGITTDAAVLNLLYDFAGDESGEVRFAYKQASELFWIYTDWTAKADAGTYSESLNGLTHNTAYYYQAQLKKSDDTVISGEIKQLMTDTVITFPDAGLEQAIRNAIHKPGGDIFRSELEGLTALNAYGQNIADLTGLQYCINLQKLYLQENQITDISLLAGLTNIQELELYRNQITDFSVIARLSNLRSLSLSENQVTDISIIAGLSNLQSLGLSENEITDISVLAGLTNLQSLHLSNNWIDDISVLAGLINLQSLSLSDNQITDITALAGLTALSSLSIDNNLITDISALAGLTALLSLHLGSNQIIDITALAGLTMMNTLDLGANQINDISSLAGMTELRNLYIIDNQVSNIGPLQNLTNLSMLWLGNNQITDITPLQNLTDLYHLYLGSNQINDITPLQNLTNLAMLYLYENQINDVSPLAGLPHLSNLNIGQNPINDISPLAGLTRLSNLALWETQVSDISALTSLTRLDYLYLGDNQISDITPLAGLYMLRILNLQNNQITDISPLITNNGISSGDAVYLTNNPLNDESLDTCIPELIRRGAAVNYDEQLVSVITCAATNVTADSVTLNGRLQGLGILSSVDVSFFWSKTLSGYYQYQTTPQTLTAAGNFTATLSGLEPGTTYYFRADAKGALNVYGERLSFTTHTVFDRPVLTMAVSGSGNVTPEAGTHIYDWGTTINITATPEFNWTFINWSGDIQNNAPASTNITMDGDKTVTAHFSKWLEGAWSTETIDNENIAGNYSSITLDSQGYPFISYDSYNEYTSGDLKVAHWDGSSWHIDTADNSSNYAGTSSSIALDRLNRPRISYFDWTTHDLMYASYNGIGWNTEVIDSSGDVGRWTSLALDENDNPHISYYDWTNEDLKYAYHDGTAWQIEVVDTTGDVGSESSLAIDSSGFPHISYRDISNFTLKYAFKDDTTWHLDTIDIGGGYTSIALDVSGKPHISHIDTINRTLKYASFDGNSWQIQTIDINEPQHTSIELDSYGYPHISYMSNPSMDLKYARWDGSVWQLVSIDSTDNVGMCNSLILNSLDNPYISYFDFTHNSLKYAHVTQPTCTLTMAVNGDGMVTPAVGSYTYPVGTTANIIATPAAGWEFVNWTGDTDTIVDTNSATTTTIMNDDYAITANFDVIPQNPDSGGSFSGGGGGGSSGSNGKTITSLRGSSSATGVVWENVKATSMDNKTTLDIPYGTKAVNANGNALTSIIITQIVSPDAAQTGVTIIGTVYEFGPKSASFDPPLTLTINYDEADIPAGMPEAGLTIVIWDAESGTYKTIDCQVDTETNTVTASISHFSRYTIVAMPTITTTPEPIPTHAPTVKPAPSPTAVPAPAPTPALSPTLQPTLTPSPVITPTSTPAPKTTGPVAGLPVEPGVTNWLIISFIIGGVIVVGLLVIIFIRWRQAAE